MKTEKLLSVQEAAEVLGVKLSDVYRALRPLAKVGAVKPHAGFSGGGKPCRLIDAEGMALLAKALKVPAKP
jgi:predicted transcriptional regulator